MPQLSQLSHWPNCPSCHNCPTWGIGLSYFSTQVTWGSSSSDSESSTSGLSAIFSRDYLPLSDVTFSWILMCHLFEVVSSSSWNITSPVFPLLSLWLWFSLKLEIVSTEIWEQRCHTTRSASWHEPLRRKWRLLRESDKGDCEKEKREKERKTERERGCISLSLPLSCSCLY